MKRKLIYLPLIFLFSGCVKSKTIATFFIGNTSKDKKTGHIRILLDSVEVYNDSIRYYSDSLIKTDDWKYRFEKELTGKDHRVDVIADNGKVSKSIEFKKDSWIYIGYYHNGQELTLNLASASTAPVYNK